MIQTANQMGGLVVANVNNPISNVSNWLTTGLQDLALVAIICFGLYLLIKRKMSNLITFAIIAAVASVFIWNPSMLKDAGLFIWNDVLGL